MSAKVDQNLHYQKLLMWEPSEIVCGATQIDDAFVTAVEQRQRTLKVTIDGVAGPLTYRACLIDLIAGLSGGGGLYEDGLERAGLIALAEAKAAWTRNISDTAPYAPVIDSMIRTMAGLNWTWEDPYTPDTFEWCGAFAAYAWRNSISVPVRRSFWSSNYRLDRWARYLPFEDTKNPRPNRGPYRSWLALDESSTSKDVAAFGPRAGDILTVGGVNTGYGKHICLVERFDPDTQLFHTVEGNGGGLGPTGEKRQGVVRSVRPLGLPKGWPKTTYFARRLIRPAPGDIL